MTVLRRVEATRAYLVAGALVGATLVWFAFANVHTVYGILLAPIAAIAVLWWWRGVFSRRRVVLWLEERVPGLRYSLAALVDAPDTRFRPLLETTVRDARFGRVLALAGLKLVGLPLAFLLAMQLVARPVVATISRNAISARGPGGGPARPGDPRRAVRFDALVTAPAYARIPPSRVENPTSITALVGSNIRFTGAITSQATMPERPTVLRLPTGTTQRMVALEPRADSAPRVVLELPARDTVLPVALGVIHLEASARDDIGIVSGSFEIIVSAGSGESFTFRSGTLGRASANGRRELKWDTRLKLDSLQLKPGDIVHLRAVARDANPTAGAEAGSSETRTLRVFRVGESDSVTIEAALPPEVGKSELSQRMLIMMTEKVVAQRSLTRAAVATESQSIGREQSRLRKRVGQIIFTRLTGEEHDEDDAAAALSDTVSPAEALLAAASAATGAAVGETHEHEEEGGPVIGVNRPLLEAFNAMWEAERRLGIGEPRQALPHMRAALAAIQKARAAERIYLRGRPPKIVLDIAKARLQGKREGIDPTARAPGPSAVTPLLARRARFHAALGLMTSDPAAAVDSLILVRVDALSTHPDAAAALDAAIGDLRAGRDATASLRAARRALAGEPTSSPGSRWSGAW